MDGATDIGPARAGGRLVGLLSTNGPLCHHMIRLLHALLSCTNPAVEVQSLDRGAPLPSLDGTDKAVLAILHFPTPELIQALADRGAPILCSLDRPEEAVALHMVGEDDFWPALRATSACFSSITSVVAAHDLPVFTTADLDAPFCDVAHRVASILDMSFGRAELETTIRIHAGRAGPNGPRRQRSWRGMARLRERILREAPPRLGHLSADDLDHISMTIAPCWDMAVGRPATAFVWPQSVFFHGDVREQGLPGAIELTGPSRCVGYGPYLSLPRGTWAAQIVCGFSVNAVGTPVRFEVENGTLAGSVDVLPERPGLFSVTLEVTIDQPDAPIQVTTSTLSGTIRGKMSFRLVTFSPAGTPPPRLSLDRSGTLVWS